MVTLFHPWLVTKSVQWDEGKHRRGNAKNAGQFGSGGSGTGGKKPKGQPAGSKPKAGKPAATSPGEYILSQPGAAKFGLTRQRVEQMSPAAVADMAAQLGYQGGQAGPAAKPGAQPPPLPAGKPQLPTLGKDTPFIIYDGSGKPVGKTTDENVAAAQASKHGGQYGFEGEDKRYTPKPAAGQKPGAQPPALPARKPERPMAIDSTHGALQDYERQRQSGQRPGAMLPVAQHAPTASPPDLPHHKTQATALQAAKALQASPSPEAHKQAIASLKAHLAAGNAAIDRMAKSPRQAAKAKQAFHAKVMAVKQRLDALVRGTAQRPERPMAIDSTRGALQEYERQRRAGQRPGAMTMSKSYNPEYLDLSVEDCLVVRKSFHRWLNCVG